MKRLYVFCDDIQKIFKKEWLSPLQRLTLVLSYLRIRVDRWLSRFSDNNFGRARLVGFVIYYKNFEDFYWTFRDVFVEGGYFFEVSKEKPFIIDCGSNIGVSVVFFKFLYPQAQIIAVEPDTHNLQYFRNTIKTNNLTETVTVVPNAVSNKIGVATLYGTGRAVTLMQRLYEAQKETKSTYASNDRGVVTTVLLSSLITRKIDCLKLDIEGAEHDVLFELVQSKAIHKVAHIIIEYHHYSSAQHTLPDILQLLNRSGFTHTVVAGGEVYKEEKGESNIQYSMITAKRYI